MFLQLNCLDDPHIEWRDAPHFDLHQTVCLLAHHVPGAIASNITHTRVKCRKLSKNIMIG